MMVRAEVNLVSVMIIGVMRRPLRELFLELICIAMNCLCIVADVGTLEGGRQFLKARFRWKFQDWELVNSVLGIISGVQLLIRQADSVN